MRGLCLLYIIRYVYFIIIVFKRVGWMMIVFFREINEDDELLYNCRGI